MRASRCTLATIEAAAIAATRASPPDHRLLVAGDARHPARVDEQRVGRRTERLDRAAHREQPGLVDVQRDRSRRARPSRSRSRSRPPRSRARAARARRATSFFESSSPGSHAPARQDHRGRDDRPRERPHAHLVDARHARVTAARELALERVQPRDKRRSLRALAARALREDLRQLARALARVFAQRAQQPRGRGRARSDENRARSSASATRASSIATQSSSLDAEPLLDPAHAVQELGQPLLRGDDLGPEPAFDRGHAEHLRARREVARRRGQRADQRADRRS